MYYLHDINDIIYRNASSLEMLIIKYFWLYLRQEMIIIGNFDTYAELILTDQLIE